MHLQNRAVCSGLIHQTTIPPHKCDPLF